MSSIPLRWGGMHFDSGGINFDEQHDINLNAFSMWAVVMLDEIDLSPTWTINLRQWLIMPNGLSTWLWEGQGNIITTVYDTSDDSWKGIGVSVSNIFKNKVMCVYAYINGNAEGVKVFVDGSLAGQNSRSDIGQIQAGSINYINIGGNTGVNGRPLHGTMFAAAIFDQILSDEELNNLINNWMCEDCYKNIDGCIFACIFDRLRFGDKPLDIINNVYGEPVDPNRPPRWKLRLVKDMEG